MTVSSDRCPWISFFFTDLGEAQVGSFDKWEQFQIQRRELAKQNIFVLKLFNLNDTEKQVGQNLISQFTILYVWGWPVMIRYNGEVNLIMLVAFTVKEKCCFLCLFVSNTITWPLWKRNILMLCLKLLIRMLWVPLLCYKEQTSDQRCTQYFVVLLILKWNKCFLSISNHLV